MDGIGFPTRPLDEFPDRRTAIPREHADEQGLLRSRARRALFRTSAASGASRGHACQLPSIGSGLSLNTIRLSGSEANQA